MSKENEYITYTRGQLEAFSIDELKKLDLYERAEIKSSVRNKNDIIDLLLKKQNSEEENSKNDAEIEATQDDESNKIDNSDESNDSKTKEEGKKSKKPVFHRPKKKRNRMTFR